MIYHLELHRGPAWRQYAVYIQSETRAALARLTSRSQAS